MSGQAANRRITASSMGCADVVVSRRALESVRRGHPWIYRAGVVQISTSKGGRRFPEEADVVTLATENGEPLGSGIWDPISPIAVRVWSLDGKEQVSAALLLERLERAIAVREQLFRTAEAEDRPTTAYRLLNGEGDRAPGFVIDRYADIAIVRIDGDAARTLAKELLAEVEAPLRRIGVTSLLLRTARRNEAPETTPLFGPLREKVAVKEHGVPFIVDVVRGQKTGAFLDQRENRRRIGELVARRRAHEPERPVRVLNLFSYTGGFSLCAALGGGVVTSVDVAAAAHSTAQESFRLAGVDPRAHAFVTADCFAWLETAKKRGGRWDVVISDPPSFAPSEKAKLKGLAAYRSLHRAAVSVLAEGGSFVAASCSSHVDAEAFATTLDDVALGRSDLRLLEVHGLPPDHPTLPSFPEGRYLKLCLLE
jgi:23S rRNA (cytosine1962-C5)-methyltransferase